MRFVTPTWAPRAAQGRPQISPRRYLIATNNEFWLYSVVLAPSSAILGPCWACLRRSNQFWSEIGAILPLNDRSWILNVVQFPCKIGTPKLFLGRAGSKKRQPLTCRVHGTPRFTARRRNSRNVSLDTRSPVQITYLCSFN